MSEDSITVIIVLGNRLKSESIHTELKGRVETAISLRQKLLEYMSKELIVLLLSGGRTNQNIPISEAEVMMDYCISNGIPEKEIIIETDSLDTIGNAVFSREKIDNINKLNNIYVVSSCYHMLRSEYIFRMCYGERFILNFDHCYRIDKPGIAEKEHSSLILAYNFFSNITPGDIDIIREKLFNTHKLYSYY